MNLVYFLCISTDIFKKASALFYINVWFRKEMHLDLWEHNSVSVSLKLLLWPWLHTILTQVGDKLPSLSDGFPCSPVFLLLQMPVGLSVGGALGDPSPSRPFRPSRYVPVSAATAFLVGATTLFLCFTWVEPKYFHTEIQNISFTVSVMRTISVQVSVAVRAVLLLHSAL